jgi:hypothetical protein
MDGDDMKYKKELFCIIIAVFLFLIVQLSFSGCASNYGSLKPSSEVTHIFEAYGVFPGHTYYYSGSETEPNAIIGINQQYRLCSQLWKKVDLTRDMLKNWIDNMKTVQDFSAGPSGSLILDHAGKPAGIWYSAWSDTVVRMGKDNNIIVHTPTLPLKKIKFIRRLDSEE